MTTVQRVPRLDKLAKLAERIRKDGHTQVSIEERLGQWYVIVTVLDQRFAVESWAEYKEI